MEYADAFRLFDPLWSDLTPESQFSAIKPWLAHYTTLTSLESILTNNEIWFSNPLFMNDLEEIRFGILHGLRIVRESESIRNALGSVERNRQFNLALDNLFNQFDTQHIFDTYVLCLSEHDQGNIDGVLSQWRAYGANGNGAALILDSGKLQVREDGSPLVLAKVHYATPQQRINWLLGMATKAAAIIEKTLVPDQHVPAMADAVFARIKMFALFTKHDGFAEEREWRVVYMRDRDREQKFDPFFHYHNGPRGIEPKLKFPIRPIPDITMEDLSFEKLTAMILLGPTTSSPLAIASVKRMLGSIKHSELATRVFASSIPLRPS